MGRLGSGPPPDIELPARLDVEPRTADMAQITTWAKGASQSGTRSVRIQGNDPLEIYRSFAGITDIHADVRGPVTHTPGRQAPGGPAGRVIV